MSISAPGFCVRGVLLVVIVVVGVIGVVLDELLDDAVALALIFFTNCSHASSLLFSSVIVRFVPLL